MKTRKARTVVISLLIIIFNIALDQFSKEYVRENIGEQEIISVIGDNFLLTKVENTGAALSMGENLSPLLKGLVLQLIPLLVMMGLLVYMFTRKNLPLTLNIAFSCIIGGGLANIYDRVLYNSVTDFMYLEIGPLHTGVFNMADFSVTFGVILILTMSFIPEKKVIASHIKTNES